jgi:hypothetical protein
MSGWQSQSVFCYVNMCRREEEWKEAGRVCMRVEERRQQREDGGRRDGEERGGREVEGNDVLGG